MRILIIAVGSRGDVVPFTGLGVRLVAAGHQVTVATHTLFEDLVRRVVSAGVQPGRPGAGTGSDGRAVIARC